MAEPEPSGSSGRSILTIPRYDSVRSPTKRNPEDGRLPGTAATKPPPGARAKAAQAAPLSGHCAGGWPAMGRQHTEAGQRRRPGGRWARPNESFHPSHARTFSQGPRYAGPVMAAAVQLREASLSGSPAEGEKENGRA